MRPIKLEPHERNSDVWRKVRAHLLARAEKHQGVVNAGREDRRKEDEARGRLKEALDAIKDLEGAKSTPSLPPVWPQENE